MRRYLAITTISLLVPSIAYADTLDVGPGKPHAKPCAAFAAAKDGDTIQIDPAGDYAGDVCAVARNNLVIRGNGGRAKIDANGKNHGDKGIWVVTGNDTTIENIEFSGAKVDDQNGAGIRQEGNNLTVRGCYFHDNENGILAGDKAESDITIESSEFARNGAGDGYSHNLYINHVRSLTFRFNYSHDGKVGHLLKSRAKTNIVAYNRLTDEGGTASYEIDLPSAGDSYVIGNVIEQSATTENPNIISYGAEGIHAGWGQSLYVGNNTVVNRRPNGGNFVLVGGEITTKVRIYNNVFVGKGTITGQAGATLMTNHTDADGDPKLADAAKLDVRLLEGSPCVDKGTAPPAGGAQSLVPDFHYVHPASKTGRTTAGSAIDIGAYELGGEVTVPGDQDGGTSGSLDAGSGPPGQTSSSGGGGASGDGGPNAVSPGAADDDGCGCRATGAPTNATFGALALLGLALALFRARPGSRRP